MTRKSSLLFLLSFWMLVSSPLYSQVQKDAIQWYAQGQQALLKCDYYLAIDSFIEALEQNPSYIESYKGLVTAYMALDQNEKAFFYAQKALPLAQNDVDFYVMYGNLLRSNKDYTGAKSYFDRVLKWQENHQGALLGMARLYRDQNNLILAQRHYTLLFNLYPNSSELPAGEVVSLLQAQGKQKEAINFVHKMENYYQASPDFAEMVSQFYLSVHNYQEAARYGNHFLNLVQKMGFRDLELRAYGLLGKIALVEGNSLKAVETLKQALTLKRDDVTINYLLGVAYLREQDILVAQDYFFRALEGSKGQEVYQEALEASFFGTNSPLNNPYRSRLAMKCLDRANELSRQYLYEQALGYAEQAKELDPQNDAARLLVAKLYRDLGYPVLSLRELSFLKNERQYKSDELENLFENSQLTFMKSPLYLWGYTDVPALNRLMAERNRNQLALFYTQLPSLQDSTEFLLSSLERLLERFPFIEVKNKVTTEGQNIPYLVERISDSFRLARENNLDFYILLTPAETVAGGFSVKAEIFLAKTATKVKELLVARFNDRSRATGVEQLAREISAFLPVKGSFIRREGNRALINVGKQDKVTDTTKFAIVRDADLSFSEETGGYIYDPTKVVGTARVVKLDDFASEVTLEKRGLVDVIDVSHWLIPFSINLP